MSQWQTRGYRTIEQVTLLNDKLEVQFRNRDVVRLPVKHLAPPDGARVDWELVRVAPDRDHLIVPMEGGDFRISWDLLRRLTDSAFARHVAHLAEDQARYIGAALRRLRDARGLTQAHVAEGAGIQVASLSRIENGHFDVASSTLWKLLAVMGCSASDLAQAGEGGRVQAVAEPRRRRSGPR